MEYITDFDDTVKLFSCQDDTRALFTKNLFEFIVKVGLVHKGSPGEVC